VTFPWKQSAEHSLEDTVAALQRDFAFAVKHTAVLVRSSDERLRMIVNTPRGYNIPEGIGTFKDGTITELYDLGMPQPGAPVMTIDQLAKLVLDKATEIGLELT